ELLGNFKESVNDRIRSLSYNVEEAFEKERPEDDSDEPTLQEDVQNIVNDMERSSATTIQVLNGQGRVLGTNAYVNKEVFGKTITRSSIHDDITHQAAPDTTTLEYKSRERVVVPVVQIVGNDKGVRSDRADAEAGI